MKNIFYIQDLPVDNFALPKTLTEIFDCLKFKPDKTGLSEFKNHQITPELKEDAEFSSSVVGFDFDPQNKNTFKISELCNHRSMSRTQAIRFLVQYLFVHDVVEELAVPGAFSCWVPFSDNDEEGSFRIFVRENGSKELFLYSSKDQSNWDTEGTFVAYAVF